MQQVTELCFDTFSMYLVFDLGVFMYKISSEILARAGFKNKMALYWKIANFGTVFYLYFLSFRDTETVTAVGTMMGMVVVAVTEVADTTRATAAVADMEVSILAEVRPRFFLIIDND